MVFIQKLFNGLKFTVTQFPSTGAPGKKTDSDSDITDKSSLYGLISARCQKS